MATRTRLPRLVPLTVLALLVLPAPSLRAAPPPSPSPAVGRPAPVCAEFSLRRLFTFSGGMTRERVVQIGALMMCLALWILMRKAVAGTGVRSQGSGVRSHRPMGGGGDGEDCAIRTRAVGSRLTPDP
jgi:hypothetical protein